ncbi:DNA primase, partial [Candidatus Micrarchaeota archaeon]|nr:DNA primase [Candidatus Micrarchaeota archaeon]
MGKTYIDTVKYLVKAKFEVDGIIEKPDIVGALFGQTEGLLGDELDFRELQKSGRLGRIEVETQVKSGKTFGYIYVPSSLDMVETSILGASLEVVDRVGPCEARISVEKIEDSRSVKRKQLLIRAKNLLKSLVIEELPESKQLTELVRDELKVEEVSSFGEDRLPAGPLLGTSESIVVVEGRADVINLLKNGIKNVVAVGGAKVGKTIAKLCNEKEVTVFLDGDRGGDIILKELQAVADIDYVARAPPGKEVEELARKEIIQCLRKRIPVEQANGKRELPVQQKPLRQERQEFRRHQEPREFHRPLDRQPQVVPEAIPPGPSEQVGTPPALLSSLKELEGTLRARIFDQDLQAANEVPIRDIMKALSDVSSVKAVVLDGIVTQRLVDLCEQKKVAFLVGVRAGTIMRKPAATKI